MVPLFDHRSSPVDRFGLLLVLTTVAMITLSLVPLGGFSAGPGAGLETLATTAFISTTLLLSLRASGPHRRWVLLGDVLVGLAMAAAGALVLLSLFDQPVGVAHRVAAPVIWAGLSTLAPMMIIRRLLRHTDVTLRTLMGAISAYLLIAIAFYFLFLTVNAFQDGEFFEEPQPRPAFMYFSLTTITTVGYGDLPPKTNLARLLASTEAIIGSVYLVTFVARLVTLLPRRESPGLSHVNREQSGQAPMSSDGD